MAASSLLLAEVICPNIADASFFNVAMEVFQDMSRGGNLPAGSVKRELNNLHALVSGYLSPQERDDRLCPSSDILVMVSNGEALSKVILEVIEVAPNATPTAQEDREDAQMGPEPSLPDSQQNPVPSRASTAQTRSVPPSGENTPQSHDVCLDGFHSMGEIFDFELTDLEWLDYEH